MNILYVYAHPNPTSFNHLLKEKGCDVLKTATHHLMISDLYADHFNAVASFSDFNLAEITPDIAKEIEKIKWADHIIFQFPLWWFSVPAILKGWLDRVLVKGFAYDTQKVFANGLLQGKTSSLIVTTQSPEEAYQITGVHGASIESFLHPLQHTLRFVGIKTLSSFIVYGAFDIDEPRCAAILARYQHWLQNSFIL